jgi:L-ascorbate metabolism protein UlaG (beta-lactamase superfamily)
MQITWFGHSAFRIDLKGAVIMIDPFLDNPTFKGDQQAAAKGATHVVVTHGHDDHTGSAVEICKTTGAVLVANPEVSDFLVGKGVPGNRNEQMNHGGELDLGAFSIAYVPAWHSSSTTIDGKPVYLGNPGGVVIRADGERTLLHMGDTGIFDGMGLIGEIYAPKIGIVPIGDRFTMGPKLAALACRRYFAFETVIPCHYETFGALHGEVRHFVKEMDGSGVEVLVPRRGEAVRV